MNQLIQNQKNRKRPKLEYTDPGESSYTGSGNREPWEQAKEQYNDSNNNKIRES